MAKFRKKASMQDIADYLGISKNSVSMALNNKGGVSKEMKEKIIHAAETLNYADYGLKKKSQLSGNLLVCTAEHVMGANENSFFNEILEAIQKEAQRHGMEVIIKPISRNMEKNGEFPSILESAKFVGALFFGIFQKSFLKKFQTHHIPMVLIDNDYDLDIKLDSVVIAHRIGTQQIVRYLIDQGHREIGFVAPIRVASAFRERWRAYKDTLELANLPINPAHSIVGAKGDDYSYWGSVEELEPQLTQINQHPTAWICGNDSIAITLLRILAKQKIRVPDDISVVGFDNIALSEQIIPGLTTVDVKKEEIGRKAVELLVNRIQTPETYQMRVSLFTDLVVRESASSPSSI